MSSTELARLEVAKRAYQAAQPRAAEVQTGVRRARLFLGRPKPRRNWFSKGLVFAVLALGGLAYAKPHSLAELAQDMLPFHGPSSPKHGGKGEAATPELAQVVTPKLASLPAAPNAEAQLSRVEATTNAEVGNPKLRARPAPVGASHRAVATGTKPAAVTGEASGSEPVVSDWGRVGQALAQGDDARALSALQELSNSDDQRTRDKADLGRAQLFMAHGDPDKACALARSLTHRRAGARIERQAQVLLKSCTR